MRSPRVTLALLLTLAALLVGCGTTPAKPPEADPWASQVPVEATGTAEASAAEEATARSAYETRVAEHPLPTSTPEVLVPGELQFDGLYFARMPERPRGYFYLRFYDDGTVISMSSTEEPNSAANWFIRGMGAGGAGTYTVDDHRIAFDTTSLDAKWSYSGTVQADYLQLGMYSHKNGWHDNLRFGFARVDVR